MTRMLGLKPPRHDSRTLSFGQYVMRTALPPVPAAQDWLAQAKQPWGTMLNTQIGCCAIAAPGHLIQSWTANQPGSPEVTIPDSAVLSAYSDVSGYDPQTGANDNGCVMLDVMNYWRKTGIGGHTIGAFASVHPTQLEVKQSVFLTGGCLFGLALPAAAQQMQGVWDVPQRILQLLQRGFLTWLHPQWQPGTWGGHAVMSGSYDAAGVKVISWGEEITMTWNFMALYAQECYCALAREWVTDTSKAPNGFDIAALTADLQSISGGVSP